MVSKQLVIRDAVKEFGTLFADGMGQIVEACKVYAEAVKADPAAPEAFRKEYPHVPEAAWGNMEEVGTGKIAVRMLWGASAGHYRLRALPCRAQDEALDNGVELLLTDGDKLQVQVSNLTAGQASQVFGHDHIRTLAEQRAWLEDRKSRALPAPVRGEESYRVLHGRCDFLKPVSLTRAQLLGILSQMER